LLWQIKTAKGAIYIDFYSALNNEQIISGKEFLYKMHRGDVVIRQL